jgi:SAM-dependent methyltransferase
MSTLADYYARRAPEYERIYEKPERQADLATLREFVAGTFSGRSVLEVACGTGHWTDVLARTARHVTGIDINDEVLSLAGERQLGANVHLIRGDAFDLPTLLTSFDAALAVFWWSHLTKLQLEEFLAGLRAELKPGSIVVFIDNIYVEGSSTPISRRDSDGNTYQMRKLDDGSTTEVLKNFPTDEKIRAALANHVREISIQRLTYYWSALVELR